MNEITDLLLILGGIALLAFGIWATCAMAGLYLFRKVMRDTDAMHGRRRQRP
jgi:hypothetical protein